MSADEVRLPLASVAHPDRAFVKSMTALRLARRWPQARLASEAGVDPGSISRMEARGGGCMLDTAWKIAEALEVTVDAMVRGEIR